MQNLIISLISIVLVATLALATLFYGGRSMEDARAAAHAAAVVNAGSQVVAALALYRSETGQYPDSLDRLVEAKLLQAVPRLQSAKGPGSLVSIAYAQVSGGWQYAPGSAHLAYAHDSLTGAVCASINGLNGAPRIVLNQVDLSLSDPQCVSLGQTYAVLFRGGTDPLDWGAYCEQIAGVTACVPRAREAALAEWAQGTVPAACVLGCHGDAPPSVPAPPVASPLPPAQMFQAMDLPPVPGEPFYSYPFAGAARAAFLSHVQGLTVLSSSFEEFPQSPGWTLPGPLAVPLGQGVDAVFSAEPGWGYIGEGYYNGINATHGTKAWEGSEFEITFSEPVIGVGFFTVDLGDWASSVSVELDDGRSFPLHLPTDPEVEGIVRFWGYFDPDRPVTRLRFNNTNAGAEYFSLDELTVVRDPR